ncbi:GNAT family N-acetyltransferase [Paraflavitalea pollutisoli]|uniref:GNAT family N-acetyltransferase n=1 Tax=Paraflavitalea pollutisoli TaxID=3034143 RepID=UPI0023ED1099|nr:GNAT family N-acetyltransferase [Paraflavitalea sp. H1-2-19X]
MHCTTTKTSLSVIEPLRALFLHEFNGQYVHNKCHLYGWADAWLLQLNGQPVGYGSVWGKEQRADRDSIFEFYVLPDYRRWARECFGALREAAQTPFIECQSNDFLLTAMLYEHARSIYAEAILFEDQYATHFPMGNRQWQAASSDNPNDVPFILTEAGETIASGGLMLNYNKPYADLYYEVVESRRRQGIGALMVQQLKKAAYDLHRIPAARCNIKNAISKATLLKGGFGVCGYILQGEL